MEEKQVNVPFLVFEGEMARAERRQKRNFILILVLIASLLLSNLGWLYAWMQYDYAGAEQIVTVDGGDRGIANYIGHDGDINNGENNSTEADADAN